MAGTPSNSAATRLSLDGSLRMKRDQSANAIADKPAPKATP